MRSKSTTPIFLPESATTCCLILITLNSFFSILILRYQGGRCLFALGKPSRRNYHPIRSILAFLFYHRRYYRFEQWQLLAKQWLSTALEQYFNVAAGIIALASSFIINNREIFIHLISITSNILFYASVTNPRFLYLSTGNNMD